MGLFDRKDVKEEKKIYKELVAIKDSSRELSFLLPQTEREFMASIHKVRIIETYKYAREIMNNNDIVKAFKIRNIGQCYDFTSGYYNEYEIKKRKFGITFMEYLRLVTDKELQLNKIEEQIQIKSQEYAEESLKIEEHINALENRIKNLNNLPGNINSNKIAQNTAKNLHNEIQERNFEKKFPQYKQLQAIIIRHKMNITSPEQSQTINNIIDIGKKYCPDFDFEDMLMPYLEEKSREKILTEDEKKFFYSRVGYDSESAKKLIVLISLNAIFFFKDNKAERDKFIKSFDTCHLKINTLYPQTRKNDLMQEIQHSSRPKR